MGNLLSNIADTLRTGFQQLINTMNRVGQIQTQIVAISRGTQLRSSDLFKNMAGMTGKGGSVSMRKVNDLISEMFTGNKDMFAGMAPASKGIGGKKEQKGIKALFSSIGSSMKAAFGPMALIMQVLSPLINAFLEPMDLMSPLFEQWGMILSQLLYPIILALMPALESLTPLFEVLVYLLLPLVDIIVLLINAFAPLLEILVMVVTWVGVSGGTILRMVTALGASIALLQNVFTGWRNKASDFFGNIIQDIVGVGTKIRDAFTDAVADIVGRIKEKFTIFKGGGLDNNTETWW